jgi:hypothetical protein
MYEWIQDFVQVSPIKMIVAGSYATTVFSQDGGASWALVTDSSSDTLESVQANFLAITPSDTLGPVFGLETEAEVKRIHEISWVGKGTRSRSRNLGIGFPDSTVTCFKARTLEGSSGIRLWIGTWGQGVFTSDNCGFSWQPHNEGLADLHIGGFEFVEEGHLVLTPSGLYSETIHTGIKKKIRHLSRKIILGMDTQWFLTKGSSPIGRSVDGRQKAVPALSF